MKWAALALAAVVLLPFLHKAYTIDDPIFLREAQNVLIDPLHPSAFPLVWSSDRRLRASEFLPGGPVAAYVLVPLALVRWREWAGHLLVLCYFAIAIVATVALARRLGLSPWAQQAAGLLTASAPAALGMAGTVMPDIAAMMFTVLGMERYIEWNRGRQWAAGAWAAVFLALAALTRINLLVLLAIAGYHGMRQSWRIALPVVLAAGLVLAGFLIARDPDPTGGTPVGAVGHQLGLDLAGRHVVALLIGFLTTTPLLVALLTRRRVEQGTLLWVWLLVPVPLIAYVQVAPKYLLPALPAAAILAAHGLDRLPSRTAILAGIIAVGATLGFLILSADARMAGAARTAAARLIRPRVEAGQRVWFAGHWGWHWYAEEAGAMVLSLDPPFPRQGDIVVSSSVDRNNGLVGLLPRTLVESWGSTESSGQVMSGPGNAGFFSDMWGLLPWSWGPPDDTGFHVWRVTK